MAAARAASRYGHRDATMILIGRHGLRASELCDLQWSQVELATSRLHVRRGKRGTPNTTAPSFDSRAQKALHTTPGMVGLLQRWSDTPSPRDIRPPGRPQWNDFRCACVFDAGPSGQDRNHNRKDRP